jgi:hypothetical protein
MTVKIIPNPIGKKNTRDEGFWNIFFSMNEDVPNRANILDTINYVERKLIFRTIEGKNGINVSVEDVDGNSYTKETKITIEVDSSAINSLLGINVLENGVTANTVPVKTFNFTGAGVSVTEASAGIVNISITNMGLFEVRVDGSSYPSFFTTFDFKNNSDAIKNVGGGVVEIDLSALGGFQTIETNNVIYTGAFVTSGSVVLSGFFGPNTPDPSSTIVSLNGLILKYSTNPSQTDFKISGNNLEIIVDNLDYGIDSDDEIIAYYWL